MSGARPGQGWAAPRSGGPVVLVVPVGEATGSSAAAAALACAASEPDRAALLIDLDEGRAPRPSLIATAGARALEQRLSDHMQDAAVASRGSICRLGLAAGEDGIERIAAALPLARESAAIVHLRPGLLRPVLEEPRIQPTAALLRADLAGDRSLVALVARDLIDRGLRAAVLKQPPNALIASLASLGVLPVPGWVFPRDLHVRLLGEKLMSQACYSRQHDAEADAEGTAQPEWRDHAGAGRRGGLHRHPQRGPRR